MAQELLGTIGHSKADTSSIQFYGITITQQKQEYNILLLPSKIKHPYVSSEPGNTTHFSQGHESQEYLIPKDKGK